jgi:hypothetical protein
MKLLDNLKKLEKLTLHENEIKEIDKYVILWDG